MKLNKKALRKMILKEIKQLSEDRPSEEEFATAGGMEQDIEMRQKRGDFEQGDYGMHGETGYSDKGGMAGEFTDHGEFPWVKAALEDLKDDEFPDKEKALQALADELGISVKVMPSDMDSEPPMTEITKEQFNETLNKLIFVELAKIWGDAK